MTDERPKRGGPLMVPGQSLNPSGRPKGVQNKLSRAAKEVIAEAAEKLGSTERLVAWTQESAKNEYAFWTIIYPKLVAQKVDLTSGGVPLLHRIEQIIVREASPEDQPLIEDVDYFEVPPDGETNGEGQ
jgi:hypothetical protein